MPNEMVAFYSLACLMEFSTSACVYLGGSTGKPNEPCQSLLIRLGLNTIPNAFLTCKAIENSNFYLLLEFNIPAIIANMPNMVNVKKLENLSGPVASPEPPKLSITIIRKVKNAKPIRTNPLIVKK